MSKKTSSRKSKLANPSKLIKSELIYRVYLVRVEVKYLYNEKQKFIQLHNLSENELKWLQNKKKFNFFLFYVSVLPINKWVCQK